MKRVLILSLTAVLVVVSPTTGSTHTDPAAKEVREFVESSDRYLHHRHLRRGMKGYGLSVFAETRIEKFEVEIVSVMDNYNPGQDLIVVKLNPKRFGKSMIIAGMSGSPVYVKDPADGKHKLIGAIAYGWSFSTVPVGGVQPITHMLSLPGVLAKAQAEHKKSESKKKKPANDRKKGGEKRAGDAGWAGPVTKGGGGCTGVVSTNRDYLGVVLSRKNRDFSALFPKRRSAHKNGLKPLSIPLSIPSASPDVIELIAGHLEGTGLVPISGGGAGNMMKQKPLHVRLEPGSSLAIPMITGDMDWAAVGTTTEVIGDTVLGFGHSMNAMGDVKLPMGTGYIHGVISSLSRSFKLGTSIRQVGILGRDEEVAVGGTIGGRAQMIPLTIQLNQTSDKRERVFKYRVVDNWFYTSRLTSSVVDYSILSLRQPPVYHHIEYRIDIDFGAYGHYRVNNRTGGGYRGLNAVTSDLARPIAAMMTNPFGPPVSPSNMTATVKILEGDITGEIIDGRLDGTLYRPGETITGSVVVERFRKDRATITFSLKLPEEIAEGDYTLTVSDMFHHLSLLNSSKPHLFEPRTRKALMDSLNMIAQPRGDRLYLAVPLKEENNLAIGREELPDLPAGKSSIFAGAGGPDIYTFRRSLEKSIETPYAVTGSRTLSIRVRKKTNERLTR